MSMGALPRCRRGSSRFSAAMEISDYNMILKKKFSADLQYISRRRTTHLSKCHCSIIINCQSYLHSINSLISSIEEEDISSENISIYFIRSSTNTRLSTLSTVNNEESAVILQTNL
jgi:hypothetical protein